MPISSRSPLKPQHSNPNPNSNPLANQLWCIDFLTPPSPLIIPHRLPAFVEFLMPLKNWCSIHARCSKSCLKHSIRFSGIFPSLKQNFIAYRFSKVPSRPDCISEIRHQWQSGFSRVYSNSCGSCSFEPDIKTGQSSHKMYSNNILIFQESTTILNACTKNLETYLRHHVYIYIYIYIYVCVCVCVCIVANGLMRQSPLLTSRGKNDKDSKLCLSSLTLMFILYYTIKVVVGRKKRSRLR